MRSCTSLSAASSGGCCPGNTRIGKACTAYFRAWKHGGLWKRIHDTLRAKVRQRAGRHKHPTSGYLDSQSVKTTAVPGSQGFDKAKLINGRKRHILVDTTGLLMAVSGDRRFGARAAMVHGCSCPAGRRLQEALPDLGGRWLPRPTARLGRRAFSVSASRSCCARKNRKASRCYRDAGWLNAPLLGSITIGGSARTTKVRSRQVKR